MTLGLDYARWRHGSLRLGVIDTASHRAVLCIGDSPRTVYAAAVMLDREAMSGLERALSEGTGEWSARCVNHENEGGVGTLGDELWVEEVTDPRPRNRIAVKADYPLDEAVRAELGGWLRAVLARWQEDDEWDARLDAGGKNSKGSKARKAGPGTA